MTTILLFLAVLFMAIIAPALMVVRAYETCGLAMAARVAGVLGAIGMLAYLIL